MHLQHFSARLDDAHLERDQQAINRFLEQVIVRQTATQFVPGTPNFWSILIFYDSQEKAPAISAEAPVNGEKKAKPANAPIPDPEPEEPLTGEQSQILAALKLWRKDKAGEAQRPEYLIVQNATLESLARKKPRSVTELGSIKGLGEHKIAQFGEDIMAILNAF